MVADNIYDVVASFVCFISLENLASRKKARLHSFQQQTVWKMRAHPEPTIKSNVLSQPTRVDNLCGRELITGKIM